LSTTLAPRSTRASPRARPTPLAPPVTTATFPFRSRILKRRLGSQRDLNTASGVFVVAAEPERLQPFARHLLEDLAARDAAALGIFHLQQLADWHVDQRVGGGLAQCDFAAIDDVVHIPVAIPIQLGQEN